MQSARLGFLAFLITVNNTIAYFVYILQSDSNGKFYIGSTGDLEKRLAQHNAGYSKSTKAGVPWTLRRVEEYPTLVEACKRERQIKKMKSRKWIESLLGE